MFEVIFFRQRDGSQPAVDFLKSLPIRDRAKALSMLELLERKGSQLREPYSKPLGDGIFELRIKTSERAIRMLYFFAVGEKIIITNGLSKKTRKTPRRAIAFAKACRRIYLEDGLR